LARDYFKLFFPSVWTALASNVIMPAFGVECGIVPVAKTGQGADLIGRKLGEPAAPEGMRGRRIVRPDGVGQCYEVSFCHVLLYMSQPAWQWVK
jgi:hypothetical protein